MLSENLKEKLKSNWGEKAQALACYAEVRLFDPLSTWHFFIVAMNPEDENHIFGILQPARDIPPITIDWTMGELMQVYNEAGERVSLDPEFRRRISAQVFRLLNEGATWMQLE